MPPKKTSASTKAGTSASTKPAGVKRGPPAAIRYYLVAFNFVSFFGWVLVLSTLLKHLALGPQPFSLPVKYAAEFLEPLRRVKIGIVKSYSHLVPEPFASLLERASNSHTFVGSLVAAVQSLAILEVVHAAIGWVRSPVPTTAVQVASRLFMVWAVSERYSQAWTSPFYASMVLAWAITECIRYPFYANQLLGSEGTGLLWARYTTFYLLYPIGAGSEAMCILATLPKSLPWNNAGAWDLRAYVFGFLFVIWWPGLYVMYTHMMRQRKKAIGKGLWGDKLVQEIAAKKRQ
ncbi:PTPLA-domain-containing protein [Testicularia cyperi]|uniref:Very-long-chain (3R)-3-hydroxyacyl-CoA dehydratase n=1 Tax=Testicularia cyperi TaxID=1882483 RepID=A0A317Y0H4_9BASI|nr:PTPLA-domain-containing protein [Testicularia cyperi]